MTHEDDEDNHQHVFWFTGPHFPQTNGSSSPPPQDDFGIKAAITADNLDAVLDALTECPDNKKFYTLMTGFFHAIKINKPRFISLLQQLGANIHAEDELALRLAVASKHPEIVRSLLSHGADPNKLAQNHFRVPEYGSAYPMNEAVIEAVRVNDLVILQDLLETGANPDIRDYMAIHLAIKNKNTAAIEMLCTHGADIFEALRQSKEPPQNLDHATQYYLHTLIVKKREIFMAELRTAQDPLSFLRGARTHKKECLWHEAISMNLQHNVMGHLRQKNIQLELSDILTLKNSRGQNIVQALCALGQLDLIADIDLWQGKFSDFFAAINTLSPDLQRQGQLSPAKINHIKNAVTQKNLQSLKPPKKLPGGF